MKPGRHVEAALAALDVGLQSTGTEHGYGATVPAGKCWKCLTEPAAPDSPAGVCPRCRAILLGDVVERGEELRSEPLVVEGPVRIETRGADGTTVLNAVRVSFTRLTEACQDVVRAVQEMRP